MSYPVWPSSLTQIERSGWQSQFQDGRRGRQTDAGPPSWRRRFSSVGPMVSLSLVTTRQGKAVFEKFYTLTCQHGSRLFWMPDPTTEGWRLLTNTSRPILTSDGKPLLMGAQWLCAWGQEPPIETIEGDVDFRFAFQVVVMP